MRVVFESVSDKRSTRRSYDADAAAANAEFKLNEAFRKEVDKTEGLRLIFVHRSPSELILILSGQHVFEWCFLREQIISESVHWLLAVLLRG